MWGSLFLSCERTSCRKGGGAGGAVVEKFVFCPGAVVGRARRAVCLMIVECDRIVERVIYFWRRRGDHYFSSRANQSIRPQSSAQRKWCGLASQVRSRHRPVRSIHDRRPCARRVTRPQRWTGGDGDQTESRVRLLSYFFGHDVERVATCSKTSRFQIRTPQSERSARESRGTLDENLRREEHCEHAEKRDDEHLQQLCRQPGE